MFFSEDDFTCDDKEDSLTKESDVSPSEQAIREINPLSLSRTSSSSNSFTNPSPSSSLLHTSVPSSCTESTDLAYGKLSPEFKPLVSVADNIMQHTPISSEPALPLLSPSTPSQQLILPSTLTPASISQQGLWHKIKNNVRASSRGGDEGLDRSPRKKLGGLFASASNGLLSRQPSRSLANGIPTVFVGLQERKLTHFFSSFQPGRELNLSSQFS